MPEYGDVREQQEDDDRREHRPDPARLRIAGHVLS
jgi:hypothetical protein